MRHGLWLLLMMGMNADMMGAQEVSQPPAIGVIASGPQPLQAAGPSGSVTVTVILGDTQHAGRMALVSLQAVSTGDEERRSSGGGFSGKTGIDGTVTMPNVGVGDYYVLATMPGYMNERVVLMAGLSAGTPPADLAAQIPIVHVTAGGSTSITVTLPRGGVLSGRVQWEDGSAATGLQMIAVSPGQQPQLPPPLDAIRSNSSPMSTTDDRGAFRITGLATGDYIVQAFVNIGLAPGGRGFLMPIQVFAPGVFHKADAKTVSVRAGDERGDVSMIVDLRSLRSVSGHVSSSTAGASVVSGRASLASTTDTAMNQLVGTITATGDFVISYVPAGTYTLTVQGSSQANTIGGIRRGGNSIGSGGGVSFKPYTQTIVVADTDITGLDINLSAQTQ